VNCLGVQEVMTLKNCYTEVSSEVKTEKNYDGSLKVSFSVTKIQLQDENAIAYRGIVRSQNTNVGEFVARVDRSHILFIEELFIKHEHRGKGIGKRTLGFLEAMASAQNIHEIMLEPFQTDLGCFTIESLKKWYAKQGYISRRRSILAPSTNILTKTVR
jgi:GNAT superfamily N-acetyltransferase